MKKFLPLFFLLGLAVFANAHGISEADKQAIVDGGNLRYLWLGAIHMVTGYDHLLFLFGVIFYLTSVKDILKFVTAFSNCRCPNRAFTWHQKLWAPFPD